MLCELKIIPKYNEKTKGIIYYLFWLFLFRHFGAVKFSKSQQQQHETFLKALGARIVNLRKKKGLSQLDLAYSIGMEKPNLRQIEKGKRNITIKTVLLIAEGLEISINELMNINEDKKT